MVGYGTDPNSTALVLQALIATGDADAARFSDRAATPLSALLSFQLGCDAPESDRGAFTFPGSNGAPNGFATAQAVAPAAGAGVLTEAGPVDPGVTPLDCDPPAPSSTTTVVPTTAAPTTAAPSSVPPVSAAPTSVVPVTAGSGDAAPQVQGQSQSAVPAAATGPSATTSGTSNLASTGAPAGPLAALGGVAVLGGLVLMAAGRRRSGA